MALSAKILDFWFDQAGPEKWFSPTDKFDAEVRALFELEAIEAAGVLSKNETHPWEQSPDGALALILMLDQFPRNIYRGTRAMYIWDPLALQLAKRTIAQGYDLRILQARRLFIYLPYMHSENLEDQRSCVHLIKRSMDDPDILHHAQQHMNIIERFGRFPHRNDILGRRSTDEELVFLKQTDYRL